MLDALALRRERSRRSGLWLVCTAVILGAAAVTGALFVPRRPSALDMRLLAAAPYRPTPGRLFGEVSYRPWRPGHAGDALQAAHGAPEPLNRAMIDLLRGDFGPAIAGFELSSRSAAIASEALTDLSAAYLARFEANHDCLDLLRAVQAADRGLAIQPASDALHFSRAMALSRLGTRLIAARAWRQIQMSSGEGGWRIEAEAELRELKRPSVDEEWARLVPRIESANASPAEIGTLALRLPANARAFGEEQLLPRWAAAVEANDDDAAERTLRLATIIGDALRRARGEELLADAVTSIHRIIDTGSSGKRQALVRGLQKFGAGVAQYNEHNLASAKGPLTQAMDDLAAVDHPLRYWARFYLAIGEYYEHADRGLAILDRLLEEAPVQRYPALAGRIDWIAGTSEKVQGRIQSSVHRYERSAAALRQAGGDSASAFANVLLAESYTLLGEHSMAWGSRRVAFQQVPLAEGPRRRIAMWGEAKEALVHQGNLALAGPFVDEAVSTADAWGRPLGIVVAYLDRAAYRLEIGARDAAMTDLRRAQSALGKMEGSPLRDQESFLAEITEGLCYRSADPARAAQLLEEGLRRQGATGKRFEAVTYTTALADAQIASGHLAEGAASLERALSIFEDIRATVEDPVSRMQAFRQAQPAFDRLIDLRTASLPADREEVFRLAERSRARVLLELRAGEPAATFVRLGDLENLLAPEVALVSYVVLDQRVLAWVVENRHARQLTLQTSRADLEKEIERFRLELTRGANADAIRDAAAPLYDHLIRPLALAKNTGHPLIIIPDRVLARLPFAALVDRESSQYLIEQRAVSITPSATLLIQKPRAIPKGAGEPALVVGVSRSGEWRGRTLPALLEAESEAKKVAALYPGASLLCGAEATRENFLQRSVSTDVIHFAGHAVVDLEAPRRSVLLFAAETSNTFASISLGELLDAGADRARLVVLAACGTQDTLADDREGLLGLAGAFVAAGVGEVVASPLAVDDESVSAMMIAFHRRYRQDHSAALAFRNTVLEMLGSRSPELRSPAAWGGFTVIQGSLLKGEKEQWPSTSN